MASGGKEANYWPGFVDALSNVVVVMVFVLVVFTIGLIHFSQNKAKEIVAQAALEQRDAAESPQEAAQAREFVSDLLASKLEALMRENEQLRAGKAESAASGPATPQASAATRENPPAADSARATPSPESPGSALAPLPSDEAVRSKALDRLAQVVRENLALREAIKIAERQQKEDPASASQLAELKKALESQQKRADQAERQAAASRAALAKERAASARAASEARDGGGAPTRVQAGAVAQAQVVADEVATEEGDRVATPEIRGQQAALAITFPGGAYLISDKTRQLLDTAFSKIAQGAAQNGVTLVASPEGGSSSEGRRLSYYRNLEIRNWLIKRGIPAEKIRMRIAEKNSGADRGVIQLSVATP